LVRISKTSKLGTLSWSLTAFHDCPGKRTADGKIAAACQGCYARGGNYRFPNVKAPREENRRDWRRDEWVADMVAILDGETHFRWFDSGDMYDPRLAAKILEVCRQTPRTRHWIPTRMHRFSKFAAVLAALAALPNVSVRFSSDSVTGQFGPEHGSVIVPSARAVPSGAKLCRVYTRDGTCGSCRACYDKSIRVIAYPQHGRAMARVVREQTAT